MIPLSIFYADKVSTGDADFVSLFSTWIITLPFLICIFCEFKWMYHLVNLIIIFMCCSIFLVGGLMLATAGFKFTVIVLLIYAFLTYLFILYKKQIKIDIDLKKRINSKI
jgi:Ca2+/Na+ antiporter